MYATWPLGQVAVVMAYGEALRSYAYERSDAVGNTSMWWQIPGYRVELTFTTQQIGTETSGGTGAMRVFSESEGDSLSLPVRVDEGC